MKTKMFYLFFSKESPQGDGDEQVPIDVIEKSMEHISDEMDDQLDEISPPTPKIRPIIAPDMFPPFVEYDYVHFSSYSFF